MSGAAARPSRKWGSGAAFLARRWPPDSLGASGARKNQAGKLVGEDGPGRKQAIEAVGAGGGGSTAAAAPAPATDGSGG